jgi:hypothetical protein
LKTKPAALRFFLCAALSVFAAWAADSPQPFAGLPLVGDATPHPGERFSFAIVGDKTSGGEGKWPIFDCAVDAMNLLEPEFAITVGDHIPGHMQDRAQWDVEWKEYLEHARRLQIPLLLIPGNHDIANTECYDFWKHDWGRTYYSFDYKTSHFLVLNTEEERFDGRGPIWEAMMRFAEDDLASHKDSVHTFVFFHKPMWDDPRFTDDWRRLQKALAGRRYTAVAGHEHYLMSERDDNGNLLVIQSATGGGIAQESPLKEYGAFHSFGYVTVDGNHVTYAVVQPEGGIWPVEVAPASFRKALGQEIVQLDADPPENAASPMVTVHMKLRFHNVLAEPIETEVAVEAVDKRGWEPVMPEGDKTQYAEGKVLIGESLQPGATFDRTLTFRVPQEKLSQPPTVTWRIQYRGQWIGNDPRPMEQANVAPIYPAACLREVPEWQIVGPFDLGAIDTNNLTGNQQLFERFGPEDGFAADRSYANGRKWSPAKSLPRGLLNFNALMGTMDHALAYAACSVYSPREQQVHALVYADNYAQVVLNGELLPQGQTLDAPGRFVYAPLHLKEGQNSLVVKLINNRGDWFLRVLLADPEGNLRFSATPAP